MTRRVTRRDLFRSPANFFALGFGAGLSRYAPGTVGTLAALPVFWLLTALGPAVYAVVVLIAIVAGVKLCARAAESLADGDDDGADGDATDGDGADDDDADGADADGAGDDGADAAAADGADGSDRRHSEQPSAPTVRAGDADHPAIVWDEMTGLWVALAFIPPSPDAVVIGVVLFRALDIAKPWPLSLIDRRVKGGLGIMLDDLAAAIAVNLTLRLLAPFLPL